MRIMFLGDTHGHTKFVKAAIDLAVENGASTILQVGDFGFWYQNSIGAAFLDSTQEFLTQAGITLIFCDGNHECFDELFALPTDADGFRRVRPSIWHAPRGHVWELGGLRIGAMGGAHSIDGPGGIWPRTRGPGNDWWPQEMITDDEVRHAIQHPVKDLPVDVMISHDAPEGVAIPGIGGYPFADVNRHRLRQVVDAWQPQLLVCGHYHLRHTGALQVGYTHDVRVEILSSDGEAFGQYLFCDTDPFTLVVEEKV